ncbi:hypothetical protein OIDMADRAFT_144085 [Oidiodendron maius Zn]|uniref:Xylanolytic transcriptional activator regulatory domain-containing protein n=1 Tax=Oidiodendron maius (strain Zn) TaxID=913774 RepID=A0A0C3H3Z6_OIDMZ|nr:hypothetical protein OIDMADRAFT_144085 [Oidiodendron maius Zn]
MNFSHFLKEVEGSKRAANQVSNVAIHFSSIKIDFTVKDASGDACSHSIQIPQEAKDTLEPEDVAYLHAKGVFLIPPIQVCEKLIRCFFVHVHLTLPVVDAKDFLTRYVDGGPMSVNLMLLWSVFLAASDLMDEETIAEAGFRKRADMADAYYTRAKKLYDMNYLHDEEIFAQSILLMAGCRSQMNKDILAFWHLGGTALSRCQVMMAEMNAVNNDQDEISMHKKPLWARMWWCCLAVNAWGSLKTGWGLRISPTDNDIPVPDPQYILQELRDLPLPIQQQYISPNSERRVEYYILYLELVAILCKILGKYNKTKDNHPTSREISRWESKLINVEQKGLQIMSVDLHSSDKWLRLAAHQCQIFISGVYVTMFRQYLFAHPVIEGSEQEGWIRTAKQKINVAASQVVSSLEIMVSLDLMPYVQRETLGVFLPVTQYYLLQVSSSHDIERRFALNKFHTCVIILEEIQKTNWYAGLMLKILKGVLERVDSGNGDYLASLRCYGNI